MGLLRIGCQTFTWQMLGPQWDGDLDRVLDAVAAAGYDGIEITNQTIGRYGHDAAAFSLALARRNLRFPALACSSESGWTDRAAHERDLALVERWLVYLERFPGTLLALGGAAMRGPSVDREHAFASACEFYNRAGRRAADHGVTAVVHPSSHHGSILTVLC